MASIAFPLLLLPTFSPIINKSSESSSSSMSITSCKITYKSKTQSLYVSKEKDILLESFIKHRQNKRAENNIKANSSDWATFKLNKNRKI